jgi:hypothetical protein
VTKYEYEPLSPVKAELLLRAKACELELRSGVDGLLLADVALLCTLLADEIRRGLDREFGAQVIELGDAEDRRE